MNAPEVAGGATNREEGEVVAHHNFGQVLAPGALLIQNCLKIAKARGYRSLALYEVSIYVGNAQTGGACTHIICV